MLVMAAISIYIIIYVSLFTFCMVRVGLVYSAFRAGVSQLGAKSSGVY